MRHRRDYLGAVEAGGAVDAAVADEHEVVAAGEALRLGEVHIRQPGAALEAENRRAGTGRVRADARDRQCDQARMRVVPVLGDDERAAVRRLVSVGAVLQGQLTRVRARRHGHGSRSAGEVEIGESERGQRDERECDDSLASDRDGLGGHEQCPFREAVAAQAA